jgi:hypothetical protein
MKLTPKIAAVAVMALTLAGTGGGAALAATHGSASRVSVATAEPTGPDHDSAQQGDQTSPDNSAALTTAGTSSPEPSSPEGETATESESSLPSDGPGGHADPSGNVQYEFSGTQ